jgi:hypothetical protein
MQVCGEVEVQFHANLPSEPEGGEWSVSCPVRFNPGEGPIILVSELEFTLEQAMKTQMGCRYSSTLSLTSALEGVSGQCHILIALRPVKRTGVGSWVGPRAGLDGCEKSQPQRCSIPGPSSP